MRTIINLAQNLELVTVAEGIEDDGQLVELQRLGCRCGQGFMLSYPLPSGETGEFLAAARANHVAA